jgi:hypothetical protein
LAIIVGESKKPLPNVITSFNEEGYKRYGKGFIESWKEYWSPRIRLTVYYEGEDFPFTDGISWKPIEEVEFLADYMEMLKFPIMHGIVGNKFDMWFDARQARKAFMEMHALKVYGGKVFWLDADNVTHSHVPESFLDDMLPDDKFSCYLGRDGWYHTESGFIGFNANHPIAEKFANQYLRYFMSGAFLANYMHGRACWNDCGGFDAIRHAVFENSDDFVNLAKDLPQGTMHPLVNTAIGAFLDHRKGGRKESRSTEKDLVIERKEAYWKGA